MMHDTIIMGTQTMMRDTIWVTQKPLMRSQVKPNSFCFVFVTLARRRNGRVFIRITDSGCLSARLFTCLPGWTSVRESVLTTLVSRRSLEVPLLPMMMRVKECSSYAQLGILVNSCVCSTSCQHQPHRRHHKQRQHHAQRQHRTVINIGHILNIVNRTERQWELRISSITQTDSGSSVYRQSHRETVGAPYIVNRTERQCEVRISSSTQRDSASSVYRQSHRETVRGPYIVNHTERQCELRISSVAQRDSASSVYRQSHRETVGTP